VHPHDDGGEVAAPSGGGATAGEGAESRTAASERRLALVLVLGLCVLTLAGYLPALRNGFVGFDDPQYVYENPHVRAGLTLDGLRWALTASVADHWHPLTMVSHMADVQLFGLNPKGHHLTSLILHLANVLLLFAVLRRMTGAPRRSAVVAALLAVHPTHVESVAWIAERKDLLCGLFWMLALAAYLRYVRAPSVGRYLLVAAAFAGSLASKAMAISLPAVLLLLDFWPLGRVALGGWPSGGLGSGDAGARPGEQREGVGLVGLVIEKLPLLALAAASTLIAVRTGAAAISSGNDAPLALRLYNALTSYVAYLFKMVYPAHLGVFYQFQPVPAGRAVAALLVLVAITVMAARSVQRAPYLLVGWLWYLVTLLPVIGILQAGWQGMADRYTYLPAIGLSIAAVWGVADLLARWRDRRAATSSGGDAAARTWTAGTAAGLLALLVLLTAMTRRQVSTWSSTLTLFNHAIEVEPSYLAHTNVAEELRSRGDTAGALAHFRAAVALAPRSPQAHAALGNALRAAGRPAEALPPLRAALALDPSDERARLTLAMALDDLGQRNAAIAELRRAAAAHPDSIDAHHGLAVLLELRGDLAGAAAERRQTAALRHPSAQP
jgi:Flp pilus assembly protein TadD